MLDGLKKEGVAHLLVRRDELHRDRLRGRDLVIAVGGEMMGYHADMDI